MRTMNILNTVGGNLIRTATIEITDRKVTDTYSMIHCVALGTVKTAKAGGNTYTCKIGDGSCDCVHGQLRARSRKPLLACRHVAAARKLVEMGKL